MKQHLSTILIAALFVAAFVLDTFMGTPQNVTMAFALDPSEIVVGIVVIGGAVYLIFGDGHVERKK